MTGMAETNVGGLDRTVRMILGPLLVLAAIASFVGAVALPGGVVVGAVALVIGGVLTYTAAVRFCKMNQLLGINTAR